MAKITRCGYDCSICLAYKDNNQSAENRQKLSDGWFKYFGFRIPPEEIYCDGCFSEDSDQTNSLDKNCPVKSCVLEKSLDNCAYCDEYICEKLSSRIVQYEAIASKFKEEIPPEDYNNFIKPYENKKRLDKIREKK